MKHADNPGVIFMPLNTGWRPEKAIRAKNGGKES